MEFNCRSWKVMENYSYVWYVNYCRSGSKDKIKCRRVMSENTPKDKDDFDNLRNWQLSKL